VNVVNAVKPRVCPSTPSTPVNTSKSESQPELDARQHIKMKQKGRRSDYNQNTRYKETTRDERVKIIALRDAGHSWKEIGRQVGIDFRTCQGICRRAAQNGTPTNQRRQGRPPIFTPEEKERLREFVTRDKRTRRLPFECIIQEMGYACNVRTIRTVLASMGYHKRLPRKK
jgi:transposase